MHGPRRWDAVKIRRRERAAERLKLGTSTRSSGQRRRDAARWGARVAGERGREKMSAAARRGERGSRGRSDRGAESADGEVGTGRAMFTA